MTAVFSHGRLRLYLLKLLDDGPKHGYELIRLLENRFHGLYAPSAGTIYPRLQRLQAAGQVTHTAAGGRKTYEITEAGRQELRERAGELVELETDINASVAELTQLANHIQDEVRGSARDLKQELREASARASRQAGQKGLWDRWRPVTDPRPDDAAEIDRQLGVFVADVRAVIRTARHAGAEVGTIHAILDSTLKEAVATLRRTLR